MKKVFLIACAFFLVNSCEFYGEEGSEELDVGELDSESVEWMSLLSRHKVLAMDSILPQFSYQLDSLVGKYYSINLNSVFTYDIRQREGRFYVCIFNEWRFSFLFGGPDYFDHYVEIPESSIHLFHNSENVEFIYQIYSGSPSEVYFENDMSTKYSFYGKMKAVKHNTGDSQEITVYKD